MIAPQRRRPRAAGQAAAVLAWVLPALVLAFTPAAQAASHKAASSASKSGAKSAAKSSGKSAAKGSAKSSTKAVGKAAAVPKVPAAPALSEAQLAVAETVYTGQADCEFNQTVAVERHTTLPGTFRVRFNSVTYTMVPEETTTGAVRLVDSKAGVVWLQIPVKSMMMNTKAGRRMVDACTQPAQRQAQALAAATAATAATAAATAASGAVLPNTGLLAAPPAASAPPMAPASGATPATVFAPVPMPVAAPPVAASPSSPPPAR